MNIGHFHFGILRFRRRRDEPATPIGAPKTQNAAYYLPLYHRRNQGYMILSMKAGKGKTDAEREESSGRIGAAVL